MIVPRTEEAIKNLMKWHYDYDKLNYVNCPPMYSYFKDYEKHLEYKYECLDKACKVLEDMENATIVKAELRKDTLFSFLMECAIKYCENYSSDIVYDMQTISEYENLRNLGHNVQFKTVLGFRENGVDSEMYVATVCENNIYGAFWERYKLCLIIESVNDTDFVITQYTNF